MKTLTLVVPAYNSADYLHRCLDTLLNPLVDLTQVEVLVVNDGSSDETRSIAEQYTQTHPGTVRVISQPNGGHGEAINTGLAHASSHFFKVVDSDDWVDAEAYASLLGTLRTLISLDSGVDLVISNYVYEKAGKSRKAVIRYTSVLPEGRLFGWEEVGRFRPSQYLLMHALTYRTELLRQARLHLPKHTFYVDNLFAYVPLPKVARMYYADVDFYRYFIGRGDQSVNEDVMISRLDQQMRVNRLMIRHLAHARRCRNAPEELHRYMVHYLRIITAVSSTMAIRAGSPEMLQMKEHLWRELQEVEPALHRRLRRSLVGQLVNLPGTLGRRISMAAYKAAQRAYGFN